MAMPLVYSKAFMLRIEPALLLELDSAARADNISRSLAIREAIVLWINRPSKPDPSDDELFGS